MKLDATLGGIAAIMLAGVFYTFSLCVVEDVDNDIISPEYYYIEPSEDDLLAEAVRDKDPAVPENRRPAENENTGRNESPFDEEAVPAAVTEAPAGGQEPETVTAPSRYYEREDNYPEEYDVDNYDDSSTEAYEQSVYGGDNFEDGTLNADDDEIFDPDGNPGNSGNQDSNSGNSEPEEPDPVFPEPSFPQNPAPSDPADGDIIITLFESNEEEPPQKDDTSVSVSVENNSGTATSETFTARFDGAVQTVNAYDLICWIVNNEISTSFSDEAIKAQAVAAYSYVKYHNVNGLTPSVLVKKNPPQRIKDLVSSVWGVCCYYNGSVAQTVYMASSSGYTADAKNVWGGSFPYLKSVACPFDAGSDPNYGLTMRVSESNMRSYLENSLNITLSGNPQNWIVITGYVDGNYVSSIDIDGQASISGRKMRETVLSYKLKSAAFDVYYSNGEFVFTTYGYGHGVGMSQNGANILAKQGYSYSEILKYYFTGIEVL